MKNKLAAWVAGFALFGMAGMANAELITIGTALYNSCEYNLIWDDDNNGNSVIWLDYVNADATWAQQNDWAAGLEGQLTFNFDPKYKVTWNDRGWRLPDTVDGEAIYSYTGDPDGDGIYDYTAGYNLANSEMGHLFYEELGNLGFYDTSGNQPQPGWGLKDTKGFEKLTASAYWSGTLCDSNSENAWGFSMNSGSQVTGNTSFLACGLALRNGQVCVSSVPVPGTLMLLWSGFLAVALLGRKKGKIV